VCASAVFKPWDDEYFLFRGLSAPSTPSDWMRRLLCIRLVKASIFTLCCYLGSAAVDLLFLGHTYSQHLKVNDGGNDTVVFCPTFLFRSDSFFYT